MLTYPIAVFPNETYLDGLRAADPAVVDALYNEFRQPVARAVEAAGGNYADGNLFFRTALLHSAQLSQEGLYPSDAPVFFFLKNLAIAHYHDWLREKGQEPPRRPVPVAEELPVLQQLPEGHELRSFRESLQSLPADNSPLARLKTACDEIERRLSASQIPTSGENKAIKYAFFALLFATALYATLAWVFRDLTPEEVYKSNFQPPASILADMAARYTGDSTVLARPETCAIAFSRADAHYQKGDWRAAANALVEMMDVSLAVCQSDALFYLAIIGLQWDRPDLTLDCISKIEDLERFGEDIYWYMALAYVKIAANDPSQKSVARRAVQRALSNTEVPERREQAQTMLDELGE
jgi:hypothetical protein